VLFENAGDTHPKIERNKKHIVAQRLWPVWDSHARLLTGDDRTQTNQEERARGGKHC